MILDAPPGLDLYPGVQIELPADGLQLE